MILNRCICVCLFLAIVGGCSFEPPQGRWKEPTSAIEIGGQDASSGDRSIGDGRVILDAVSQADVRDASTRDLDDGRSDIADFGGDHAVAADLVDAADGLDVPAAADQGPDLGITECGGQQVDLRVSSLHCGACDNACDPAFGFCSNGTCACSMPNRSCSSKNRCADILADPAHCGACGVACQTGEICLSGACECAHGLTRCQGSCVDLERDPLHCGGCGVSCSGSSCQSGQCGGSCDIFHLTCTTAGGESCVDSGDHLLFCGADFLDSCGQRCSGQEYCLKTDLFSPRRCHSYWAARGCTTCPCADCEQLRCATLHGEVYCVD
jgi:hypothetical protein